MDNADHGWRVRYKNEFLRAVMEELAGNAQISFEGDLSKTRLSSVPGFSSEETAILKRNTGWPIQDFAVVPLDASTVKLIFAAIGGSIQKSIRHIQIAKTNSLQFTAYDNFCQGCIVFGDNIPEEFIKTLIDKGWLQRITGVKKTAVVRSCLKRCWLLLLSWLPPRGPARGD